MTVNHERHASVLNAVTAVWLKILLGFTTIWATPVIWEVFERRARANTRLGVAFHWIIDIIANRTAPFLHCGPPFR
jgi:membrane-bound metal-dependent hydrolase YbcI (DUF457 family)